jgi:hypothetical protein
MNIHKIYKSLYPLVFLNQKQLLVYRKGSFYNLNLESSNLIHIVKFKLKFHTYIISCIPILVRIFRLTIRASVKYNKEGLLIFSFQKKIYEMNLETFEISKGFDLINSRPLNFEIIDAITGIEDGVYFGEYKSNPQKKQISIYKRCGVDNWNVVYTFNQGIIEHVHNIITDKTNDMVYVLTGDFGNGAAIWSVKNNFNLIEAIHKGDQNFRSCIAFPTSDGLVYATDSPFTNNSIRLLQKNDHLGWVSSEIIKINGPCIYGVKFNNDLIFSTSVEGEGSSSNFLNNLFSIKRGPGIVDDFVCVYKGNINTGFNLIYKSKKDKLPYLLFQFGAIIFPIGEIHGDYLPMFEIGTCNYNMSTVVFKNNI